MALLARAAGGDTDAFAELYRRHADAAWRAARALLASADDAADAVADAFTRILRGVREGRGERITHFRAYLLTATRHAALDRRRGREIAVDLSLERNGRDDADTAPTPSELVIDLTDESFVMRAFADLPERWRRVLWLTEVEGLRPVDAAEQLGMNANSVAQLSYRARSALRERYVQAHVRASDDDACTRTVERLGAHVVGKLGERERRAVDEHLAECGDCRERRLDLDDVQPLAPQRRLPALAPITLAAGGALRKALDVHASTSLSTAPASILSKAAVVVAGVAVSGAALLNVGDPPPPGPGTDHVPGIEREAPLTDLDDVVLPVAEERAAPSSTSSTSSTSSSTTSSTAPSTTSTTVAAMASDPGPTGGGSEGSASDEPAATTTTPTTTTTVPGTEGGDGGGDEGEARAGGDSCEAEAPGRSGDAPGRQGDCAPGRSGTGGGPGGEGPESEGPESDDQRGRGARGGPPEPSGRSGPSGQSSQSSQSGQSEASGQSGQSGESGQSGQSGESEQSGRSGRSEASEQSGQSEQSEQSGQSNRSAAPGRSESSGGGGSRNRGEAR